MAPHRARFSQGPYRARELGATEVPALQRFFDANPEYFETVNGRGPRADEAHQEFIELPPAGMTFEKKWMLGFFDANETLVGMATVLSDFIARQVWHIGLFIIATPLHGRGVSRPLYEGLEAWMRENGALWVRLGVVVGNRRAERFWERLGYVEVRQRTGIETGLRISDIRVMVKRVGGGPLTEYRALVPRDRPGTP